jgi:hypothetical protein
LASDAAAFLKGESSFVQFDLAGPEASTWTERGEKGDAQAQTVES